MKKNIDRLYEKKWGIFHHYLQCVNNEKDLRSYGRHTSWNECVHEFDVKKLARQLHDIGVGYYFITLMQGTKYMLAPNATYDKIAGTKPGEVCSTRDLPMELAEELAKYDIDLYLYYTGDGPYTDPEIGPKFNYTTDREGNMNDEFVEKWASVLEEYAVRYGDNVKGWWIDGCYDWMGYTNERLLKYKKAVEKGNPDAIVAFNNASADTLGGFNYCWEVDDFTSGEAVELQYEPKERFINRKYQAHVFDGIGANQHPYGRWGNPMTCMYSPEYIYEYVKTVTNKGGGVTLDTAVYRDGWLDPVQYDVLKQAGDMLKKEWNK